MSTRRLDATRQLRAVEYKPEAPEWLDPKLEATRYADWARTWIDTRGDLRPKRIAGYMSLLNSLILPTFGEVLLGDIKAIDVEKWVADMATESLSPSRTRQAHNVLAYCAIREGEAVALRRRNANIVRSELRITESVTEINGLIEFGATKNRSIWNVTVPNFLMKRIEEDLDSYLKRRLRDKSLGRWKSLGWRGFRLVVRGGIEPPTPGFSDRYGGSGILG